MRVNRLSASLSSSLLSILYSSEGSGFIHYLQKRVAHSVMGRREIRVDPDDDLLGFDRLLEPAELAVGNAGIVMGGGGFG